MIASIIYNGREIPIGESNEETTEIKNDINNINTEIVSMKQNFQAGCDSIVGALTAKGVIPTTNSPSNISNAINSLGSPTHGALDFNNTADSTLLSLPLGIKSYGNTINEYIITNKNITNGDGMDTLTYTLKHEYYCTVKKTTKSQSVTSMIDGATFLQRLNLLISPNNNSSVIKNAYNKLRTIQKITSDTSTDPTANILDFSLNGDNSVLVSYNNSTHIINIYSPYKKLAINNIFGVIFLNLVSLPNIKSIPYIHYLDTSNVSNMSHLFDVYGRNFANLQGINLYNWDTSNVSNMDYMFYQCKININTSNLNTVNCTNMYRMFYGCNNNQTINVSGFNTSKVIYMDEMFANTYSSDIIGFENFKTNNVRSIIGLFHHTTINIINISSWNLNNLDKSVTTQAVSIRFGNIFSHSTATDIILPNIYVAPNEPSVGGRMSGLGLAAICENCMLLRNIDISHIYGISHIGADNAFMNCYNLINVKLPQIDRDSYYAESNILNNAFRNCYNLKYIHLYNYSNIFLDNTFNGCTNLYRIYYLNGFSANSSNGSKNSFVNCYQLTGDGGLRPSNYNNFNINYCTLTTEL